MHKEEILKIIKEIEKKRLKIDNNTKINLYYQLKDKCFLLEHLKDNLIFKYINNI